MQHIHPEPEEVTVAFAWKTADINNREQETAARPQSGSTQTCYRRILRRNTWYHCRSHRCLVQLYTWKNGRRWVRMSDPSWSTILTMPQAHSLRRGPGLVQEASEDTRGWALFASKEVAYKSTTDAVASPPSPTDVAIGAEAYRLKLSYHPY